MSRPEVHIEHVTKTYHKGTLTALDDLSLSVEEGELFGLIGPDGAGKTTLFRILTTLLVPDSGSAFVSGLDVLKDVKAIRSIVGYMPGRFSLYQDLSVAENLRFFATLFGTTIEANYDLIKDIYQQLEPFAKRRAGKLSGGMKQKLALCCALVHRPRVLFLDEPTTGVDTVSRKEFWGMLKRLKAEGMTIVVSTPYMDEATMCERIALIQSGKIMSVDRPDAIMDRYPYPLLAVKADRMSQLLQDLRAHRLVSSSNAFGEYHHITLTGLSGQAAPAEVERQAQTLQAELEAAGHAAVSVEQVRPTIEDCFIELMSA